MQVLIFGNCEGVEGGKEPGLGGKHLLQHVKECGHQAYTCQSEMVSQVFTRKCTAA